jgi:alpha-L-rhamnosidase
VACDEAAIYQLDMSNFYPKSIRDYGEAACEDGGLTENAPYLGIEDFGLGGRSGPIGWGTAHPMIQCHLLQHYGNLRLLERQFTTTRRWIEFLERCAEDQLITVGIGDHETLAPKSVPVTSTAFYYQNVRDAERIAEAIGRPEEAARLKQLGDDIRRRFNEAFLDPATGKYHTGTQCNQAFALHLNLAPVNHRDAVLGALVDDIMKTNDGHLTTGIFGTNYMLQALSELGRTDVAYTVANQKDFPGWNFMFEHGATTLWETWKESDNVYSRNHPMFGSVAAWMFEYLAGIRPARETVGFDRFFIAPRPVGDLQWVRAHYDSVRGRIESNWKRDGDATEYEVLVPPNSEALVFLPAASVDAVTESGKPIDQVDTVAPVENAPPGVVLLRTTAGRYQFRVKSEE